MQNAMHDHVGEMGLRRLILLRRLRVHHGRTDNDIPPNAGERHVHLRRKAENVSGVVFVTVTLVQLPGFPLIDDAHADPEDSTGLTPTSHDELWDAVARFGEVISITSDS